MLLHLPLPIAFSVTEQLLLSSLQDLVNLCLREGELPYQRVRLVNPKYLKQRIDGVNAVLGASTTTAAGDLRAYRDLVLLLVGCLQG